MDSNLAFFLAASLVAAVIIVWTWKEWHRIQEGKEWHAKDTLDDLKDAVEAVSKFAPAADKLVAMQKLAPGQRKDYVVGLVKQLLPDLDPEIIGAIVEWWVVTQKPSTPQATEAVTPAA